MLLTYLSQKKKKILKLYPSHYVKLLLVSTLVNIPAVITAEMFTKGKNPVINTVIYIQNCSCSWLLLQLGHRNPILDRLTWYFFKKQQIKCSNSQHKTLRGGSYLYIVYSLAKGRFCWYFCSIAWGQRVHNFRVHDHALQTSLCTRKFVHWQNVICSSLDIEMLLGTKKLILRNILHATFEQIETCRCFSRIMLEHSKYLFWWISRRGYFWEFV